MTLIADMNGDAKGADPAWADGGVILPWTAWRRYGDLSIIDQNWQAI